MGKQTYLTEEIGILPSELIAYGNHKFKVDLAILNRLKDRDDGKLILVTAINPTASGEGKTTVSIGLAQGLKYINKRVMLALREPSLGPVFGMKGGATGGGVSSLEPSMDINLHFTGDLHAITSAHNLLSAVIDNHLFFDNDLNIEEVFWPRALDVNDRALRSIQTRFRQDRFVITAASEIMAILALSKDFNDLKTRLSQITFGINKEKKPLYVKDLGVTDALALLLRDAIKPNIVFANEGVVSFVHAGPFANIAHGCSSVIATNMALKLSDYVVTEAGFGADLGMEKFLHIKQPLLSKNVDLVVVVATLKALKLHGDKPSEILHESDKEALIKGVSNLEKHIENIKKLGLNYVVALNKFDNDSNEELEAFDQWAKDNDVSYEISEGYQKGGKGTFKLAQLVVESLEKPSDFKALYAYDENLEDKIGRIAQEIYGAESVSYTIRAKRKLNDYKDMALPVCMAKTPLSLSGDATLKGRPKDFVLNISDIQVSSGAKLIVALTKGINVMPGLSKHPQALNFKLDDKGEEIK